MKKITNFFVHLVKKYLPDAFTVALIFLVAMFGVGMIVGGQSFPQMLTHWSSGFFGMLPFTLQMIMVMFTGHALANSSAIKRGLRGLARIPKNNTQAVMLLFTVTFALCYFNWGLGLVGGAIIAKEIARVHKGMHFPLLVAVAYGANNTLLGLSSGIPLTIATPGHFLEETMGVVPLTESLFAPWNLIITVVSFAVCFIIYTAMAPRKPGDEIIEVDPHLFDDELLEETTKKPKSEMTVSEKINNSRILTYIVVAIGLCYFVYYVMNNGLNLNIETVIILFYVLGMAAYGTPAGYARAVKESMVSCYGIAMQFPIYASIMGMMRDSGVTENIADWFISISTAETFPLFTFLSAGLINFLVPGGGSQWAVQGPFMIPAGLELGVEPAKVAISLAWGDVWTNLLQPFWALPVLAVAKLEIKDVMGYCAVVAIAMGVVVGGCLLFVL